MPEKGFSLSEEAAKRTAEAVRQVETMHQGRRGYRPTMPRGGGGGDGSGGGQVVRVTSTTANGDGYYPAVKRKLNLTTNDMEDDGTPPNCLAEKICGRIELGDYTAVGSLGSDPDPVFAIEGKGSDAGFTGTRTVGISFTCTTVGNNTRLTVTRETWTYEKGLLMSVADASDFTCDSAAPGSCQSITFVTGCDEDTGVLETQTITVRTC